MPGELLLVEPAEVKMARLMGTTAKSHGPSHFIPRQSSPVE